MSKYSPEYITKRHSEEVNLNFINKAIKEKSILEAKVVECTSDLTLVLNLGKNIVGKITFDELEYNFDGKPQKDVSATTKVGKHVKFIATSVDKDEETGKYVVQCSRKQAQQECYDNFISKLLPGDVIDAHVIRTMNYGVFCDIGCGIVALLPTNNISVTHIIDPINELKFAHSIKVVVKSRDDSGRLQLTHKELLGTWEEEISKFHENDIVTGTVISIEDYGVFIRLSQNLSGLAEIPNIDLKNGDKVSVKILAIRPDNMKVKLLVQEVLEKDDNDGLTFTYKNSNDHIKEWIYSTEKAKKRIESYFNE